MRGGAGGPVTRPTRPLTLRSAMTPPSAVSTSTIETSPQSRTRLAADESKEGAMVGTYPGSARPVTRATSTAPSASDQPDRLQRPAIDAYQIARLRSVVSSGYLVVAAARHRPLEPQRRAVALVDERALADVGRHPRAGATAQGELCRSVAERTHRCVGWKAPAPAR